jgi:hypothetical protein
MMTVFRILALTSSLLASTAAAQVDGVLPEEIEECLVERVSAEAGREFEFFLACCMRLGLDEQACRERWASQLPPEQLPPAPAPDGSLMP